jgi:hypothetical protein
MRIHIIGSLRKFDKDIVFLRTIANVVNNAGNTITQNWFEGVDDRKSRGTTPEELLDWNEIVETNTKAAIESDALIIEGSRFNYSQGFQTALALEHNKPVLNLYREDLPEYQEWPDKLFVSGIAHPLFTSKAYKNEKDLERIVTQFLKDHTKKTQELDVKLALETDAYDKIDQLARQHNKSKTSVVKDIVLKGLNQ